MMFVRISKVIIIWIKKKYRVDDGYPISLKKSDKFGNSIYGAFNLIMLR